MLNFQFDKSSNANMYRKQKTSGPTGRRMVHRDDYIELACTELNGIKRLYFTEKC